MFVDRIEVDFHVFWLLGAFVVNERGSVRSHISYIDLVVVWDWGLIAG